MSVKLLKGDITKLTCDAIVNAANSSLRGGGGVDGAIHRAAGKDLETECKKIGKCPTGEARITKGYNLPSKYIIHTVGPIWQGGTKNEERDLKNAYRNSLTIALNQGLKTLAFPLISGGAYGYPKQQAIAIAVSELLTFDRKHDGFDITLVLFGQEEYNMAVEIMKRLS